MSAKFEFSDEHKAELAVGLLHRGEVKFGDFVLRAGNWSPMYVDLRPTGSAIQDNPSAPTMTKEEQLGFRGRVVETYTQMLEEFDGQFEHIQAIPEAVCGIAPMVAFNAGVSYLHRRIKMKEHGLAENILGDFHEGDRTILLDDLISTSGAKIDERNLVMETSAPRDEDGNINGVGLVVENALILLDRETGGIEAAAKEGLAVHAATTISEVLSINHQEGQIDDTSLAVARAFISGELTSKDDIPKFV